MTNRKGLLNALFKLTFGNTVFVLRYKVCVLSQSKNVLLYTRITTLF